MPADLQPLSLLGNREAHVQPAAEGTRKGPDTAEFTAQAGEGWSMMLLNCPPHALPFCPPISSSLSRVGFSVH